MNDDLQIPFPDRHCRRLDRLHPPPALRDDGLFEARLGQTINLGRDKISLVRVVEDSRCPMEARCIQAGKVAIAVTIRHGRHRISERLSSDQQLMLSEGRLELVSVMPAKSIRNPIEPRQYRFSLRYSDAR